MVAEAAGHNRVKTISSSRDTHADEDEELAMQRCTPVCVPLSLCVGSCNCGNAPLPTSQLEHWLPAGKDGPKSNILT